MTVYPTHEDVLKNRIMDAAIVCMHQKGVDKTRIGDIARETGVVRQTIYNYFENKNQLFDAVFSREAIKLAEDIAFHIAGYQSLEDKFIEAFVFAVGAFPENAVLNHVLVTGGSYLHDVGHSRENMQAFGELALKDVFVDYPGLMTEAAEISEYLSRNIVSFLVMPDPQPRSRSELKRYVEKRIIPGLHLSNIASS